MERPYFKQTRESCLVTSLANLLKAFGPKVPRDKLAELEEIEEFSYIDRIEDAVSSMTDKYVPDVYATEKIHNLLIGKVRRLHLSRQQELEKLVQANKPCLIQVSYAKENHAVIFLNRIESGKLVIVDPLHGRPTTWTTKNLFKTYRLNAVIYIDVRAP